MAVSSEGAMMLAFNDASQLGMRTPLTISTSLNQGTTWEEKAVLESNLTASFSYPTLLCPPDSGSCFVIYTVNAHPTMPATRTRQCRCSHVCKAHLRKAGAGYDKEAADLNESCKASPCQENQDEASDIQGRLWAWWHSLRSMIVLETALQQPPCCHKESCGQKHGCHPKVNAWGWTALGMKVAAFSKTVYF